MFDHTGFAARNCDRVPTDELVFPFKIYLEPGLTHEWRDSECRLEEHVSTSYAEQQNLNVRMHTRRFTRLTNAFSKKVVNHAHSVALFAMYYDCVRIHKTLRTTPAMAAGVTKRLWEIGDIIDVLEAWEASNAK
jgi:hypothetical protein